MSSPVQNLHCVDVDCVVRFEDVVHHLRRYVHIPNRPPMLLHPLLHRPTSLSNILPPASLFTTFYPVDHTKFLGGHRTLLHKNVAQRLYRSKSRTYVNPSKDSWDAFIEPGHIGKKQSGRFRVTAENTGGALQWKTRSASFLGNPFVSRTFRKCNSSSRRQPFEQIDRARCERVPAIPTKHTLRMTGIPL